MTATAKIVAKKVGDFCTRIEKKYEYSKHHTIVIKKSDLVELRTDAIVYDKLANPSMADYPEYDTQDKFEKMLEKLGWHQEYWGQGIIHIYRG